MYTLNELTPPFANWNIFKINEMKWNALQICIELRQKQIWFVIVNC